MKNKPLEMCLLFDFYGEMLTDKQKEMFDLYYNEDLSLAEISEHVGITRQGVSDALKKARVQLEDYENKLGLAARYRALGAQARSCLEALSQVQVSGADAQKLRAAREALENIINER